jgi:GlpG protein
MLVAIMVYRQPWRAILRKAGAIPNPELSQLFKDVLKSQHFVFHCDTENNETVFWLEDDDRITEGKKLLADFLANPQDPNFQKAKSIGRSIRRTEKVEEVVQTLAQKRQKILHSGESGLVSKWLMGISLGLFIIKGALPDIFDQIYPWIIIVDPRQGPLGGLDHGQLWRLLTPMFWHGDALHIFFNLWWMWDLGRGVERFLGSWKFAILVCCISVPAHLAQLIFVGPFFGGLSGLVYGLLGYVWWRGKRQPQSGLQMDPQIMMFMMAWLLLGFFGMSNVANFVHAGGLIAGVCAAHLATTKAVK